MYYIGWEKGYKQPLFHASIGLAISDDGQDFMKMSVAPIMGRSEHDPCLVTSPHVYRDDDLWNMNYVSGVKWTENSISNTLKSFYHIKSATSQDMIHWERQGDIAIDFEGDESNIARPSVYKDANNSYNMWYSYVDAKIGKYRMGCAHSNDGKSWDRKDKDVGIGLDDDFCQEMISYPQVFNIQDRLYMLYNGDQFGKQGFGIAICELPS